MRANSEGDGHMAEVIEERRCDEAARGTDRAPSAELRRDHMAHALRDAYYEWLERHPHKT